MKWRYWIEQYTRTHCTARGLRPLTIAAYEAALCQFKVYVDARLAGKEPDEICAREILGYLQYLRIERDNGDSAVNRAVVILRSFYRAVAAMGYMEPAANPMTGFPTIKATPRKVPITLTTQESRALLDEPARNTIIGLRDRALLAVLYGTGIRASECATLTQRQLDLQGMTITVTGKGGHQRTMPLNEGVAEVLQLYCQARGPALPDAPVFRSRRGRVMSRSAIFERVRLWGRRARIGKPLSPHRLRHTFATHLLRAGVGLVTLRDLLGHRLITSTQIYLHVTAQDLRAAAAKHPIAKLLGTIEHLLPGVRLPFQYSAYAKGFG